MSNFARSTRCFLIPTVPNNIIRQTSKPQASYARLTMCGDSRLATWVATVAEPHSVINCFGNSKPPVAYSTRFTRLGGLRNVRRGEFDGTHFQNRIAHASNSTGEVCGEYGVLRVKSPFVQISRRNKLPTHLRGFSLLHVVGDSDSVGARKSLSISGRS